MLLYYFASHMYSSIIFCITAHSHSFVVTVIFFPCLCAGSKLDLDVSTRCPRALKFYSKLSVRNCMGTRQHLLSWRSKRNSSRSPPIEIKLI